MPKHHQTEPEKLKVRKCGLGWGVFAKEELPLGTVLGPIHGTVMKAGEGEEGYTISVDEDHDINSEDEFQFINHSCQPNTVWAEEEMKVVVIRRISKGEQLTVDYGEGYHPIVCKCGAKHCRGTIGSPYSFRDTEYVMIPYDSIFGEDKT